MRQVARRNSRSDAADHKNKTKTSCLCADLIAEKGFYSSMAAVQPCEFARSKESLSQMSRLQRSATADWPEQRPSQGRAGRETRRGLHDVSGCNPYETSMNVLNDVSVIGAGAWKLPVHGQFHSITRFQPNQHCRLAQQPNATFWSHTTPPRALSVKGGRARSACRPTVGPGDQRL